VSGGRLLIRADASPRIGTGHIMRCLALAQAWQNAGGQSTFVLGPDGTCLKPRLETEGLKVSDLLVADASSDDAKQTLELARRDNAAWIVVDGYHFDDNYQRKIKQAGLRLLWIDDYGHASHYVADVVLNQNISAKAELYASRESYTKLLLGTRYALLRREFLGWHGWSREIPQIAKKLLITLGGSDPNNVTLALIHVLEQIQVKGVQAVVVVGVSNLHYDELEAATRNVGLPIRLERNTKNMPELMAWADVAVSAGGSTCWELAFMGLPSLLQVVADNQRDIVQGLDQMGVAINLGQLGDLAQGEIAETITDLLINPQWRNSMCQLGRELVDGYGAARVVDMMKAEA
jgi:UDP-2,4-diacetamido-2,4,6-trideoxy-beta-L-altropyranose hydrolase